MIGIDITSISRFIDAKPSFIKKILHPNEIMEYDKAENKEKFLASRWAIKEAIYKADNNQMSFNKINIIKLDKKYSYLNFDISTSLEKDIYIAIVRKEG